MIGVKANQNTEEKTKRENLTGQDEMENIQLYLCCIFCNDLSTIQKKSMRARLVVGSDNKSRSIYEPPCRGFKLQIKINL